MTKQYAVILVDSTSHAVRIEKILKARKIESRMIPVPRQISSDCGVCVRITQNQVEPALAVIREFRVEIREIVNI